MEIILSKNIQLQYDESWEECYSVNQKYTPFYLNDKTLLVISGEYIVWVIDLESFRICKTFKAF